MVYYNENFQEGFFLENYLPYSEYKEEFEEWKKEKGSADSRTLASNSERSGAVSGNSSSKGLFHESSEHLSHSPLASQEDVAKLLKILKRH